jgi:hypothetical protein
MQEANGSKGTMLKILKEIHESTFKGCKAVLEEGQQ